MVETSIQSNPFSQVKIGLIGATGAIGKEIMDYIKADSRISEIVILCRKVDEQWQQWTPKVTTIIREDFLKISSEEDVEVRQAFTGVDIFLCTLGTRVKVGDELFKRVDYEYPLEFARLCKVVRGKFYGLLTAQMSDPKSFLLYTRTKGEVERDCKALDLDCLTIFQPALLLNRRNDDRLGEKIGSFVPFIPKIECRDLGAAMVEHGYRQCNAPEKLLVIENNEIKKRLAQYKQDDMNQQQ